MLPASSSVLVLVLLQAPAQSPPPAVRCADVQRVELSLVPTTSFEVCVSPGLMTGFRFDAPVKVDLHDDVRFEEVMQGRSGMSFVPPKDLAPGERLRLTAHLGGGESPQSITFALVAHRGRGTRQVEVYRDKRTRESYQEELEQEHAKNQQLREENQRLRAQLAVTGGLRSLLLSGALGDVGISVQQLTGPMVAQHSDGGLSMSRGASYRSKNSVAVEVLLFNASFEPWAAAGASLTSPKGEALEGVRVGQEEDIPYKQARRVFVEADAATGFPRGEVTLRLWSADGRSITLPRVTFP